jgi:hypothetical protein
LKTVPRQGHDPDKKIAFDPPGKDRVASRHLNKEWIIGDYTQ